MRPLTIGYLNPRPFTSDEEVAVLKRALTVYAEKEGFCLGDTYVEHIDSQASAFNALLEVAKREEVAAVIVPALYHLARFPGLQLAMKELLERETGARLLVMYPSPEGPA